MKSLKELCMDHYVKNINTINDGWLRKYTSYNELIRVWHNALK